MLDIDINFLKFLLNPNYEYISNDIKTIENYYLYNTKQEYLNDKIKIFNNTIYLFVNDINELKTFIEEFNNSLIEEVYIKFASFFNISLNKKITNNNNFIEEILNKNNIKYLYQDTNLNILTKDIKTYLIKNSNDKLAIKSLNYLNELLIKYQNIYNILIPYIKTIEDVEKKRKEITIKILKKIMLENKHLLTSNEIYIINNTNNYNEINVIFSNKFNLLFKNIYKYDNDETILDISDFINKFNDNIINTEITLSKINYRSKKIMYKDKEAILKIIEDVNKYNLIYNKLWKNTRKKLFINQLNVQLEKIINNKEIIYFLSNSFFESFEKNKDGHAFSTKLKFNDDINISFTISKTLKNVCVTDNTLGIQLYHVLSHEIKHTYYSKKINTTKDINNLLLEPYIDYSSIKVLIELINLGFFQKKGTTNLILNSSYSDTNFMLIDLFSNYYEYFEQCLSKRNLKPLINLIGEDTFNELLDKLNSFDLNKAIVDSQYRESYLNYSNSLLDKINIHYLKK